MLTTYPIKRRDWMLLLIILFSAALLRFGQPGVVEFFHDDAMLSTLAQNMARGGQFVVTGILSSVGIPNPPVSVYVMALPFAISPEPIVAVLFVMLLNVLGVGLLWLLATRYFGRTVAMVAGFAYAFNPWAVLFSRKIWAQDFHTPFILLGILLGLYGFAEAGRRAHGAASRRQLLAQVLCLPVLLLGMQIHFAAWALLPLYLLMLWMGRQRLRWPVLVATAALSLLVLLPYAVGLSQTLTADPTRISDALNRSEASDGLALTADSMRATAYILTGLGMETWVAPDQQAELLATVPPPAPLWLVNLALGLLGIVAVLRSRSQRSLALLLLLWGILPQLLLVPNFTPVYVHYFIAGIPALMLWIALGADALVEAMARLLKWMSPDGASRSYRREGRMGLLLVLAAIGLTQAVWWRGLLRYVDVTAIAYPGFTTPYHYLEDARQALRGADDVLVLSHGMAWNLHHEAAMWPVLLRDDAECVRTVVTDGYFVRPAGPFAVMVAPEAPAGPLIDWYQSADTQQVALRPGEGAYTIYRHDAAPEWQGEPLTPIEPVTFDSGVQLTAYALDADRLVLAWRLPARQPGLDYQYSAQLLDVDGNRLGQIDRTFWHGRHWCAGDELLTAAELTLTDEAVVLRVSLYQLGTGAAAGQYFGADVLDAMGHPAGQWVDIPLR